MMMYKIVSELIVCTHIEWGTWRTKKMKNLQRAQVGCQVPAKDPPKVKLMIEESLITQKYKS